MLSQSSLLGGILGASPLLLEHFPIHLSPRQLGEHTVLCDPSSVLSFRVLSSPSMFHLPLRVSSPRRGVNSAAARSSGRENSTRQDWTGQSRTAFIRLKKKTQPNPKPGPQPAFRIRKVLSHFPVSIWLEPSLADAWEAGAPLLLNCFLFWRIIRDFT